MQLTNLDLLTGPTAYPNPHLAATFVNGFLLCSSGLGALVGLDYQRNVAQVDRSLDRENAAFRLALGGSLVFLSLVDALYQNSIFLAIDSQHPAGNAFVAAGTYVNGITFFDHRALPVS
jgi:hypothetical protein